MDWGNASDLASAGCNIVMASSAVYAAFNAKRWFSQRSHTRGFDKAEELLSQIDDLFYYTAKIQEDLYNFWDYLEKLERKLIQLDDHKNAYFISLIDELTVRSEKILQVMQDAKLIERWSIKLKNRDVVFDVLGKLHQSFYSSITVYTFFQLSIQNISNYIDLDIDITNSIFRKHYKEAVENTSAVNPCYEKMINLKFTQLFAIK